METKPTAHKQFTFKFDAVDYVMNHEYIYQRQRHSLHMAMIKNPWPTGQGADIGP